MSISSKILADLRTQYLSSSWALWSDAFPEDGCIEETPEELIDFIESQRDRLTPTIVFVSLNPSGDAPTKYANFHSPKGKHYDYRLKTFIQENGLETLIGGYMTDIVPDIVDPDSENVTPETADIERFLKQLDILDESEYHIICFTGKTFAALREYFEADPVTDRYQVDSFTATVDWATLHVYRVWFYGLYGTYQEKVEELEDQLKYLNETIAVR